MIVRLHFYTKFCKEGEISRWFSYFRNLSNSHVIGLVALRFAHFKCVIIRLCVSWLIYNSSLSVVLECYCRAVNMAADQHISDLAEFLFQFQRDGHLCDVTLVAKNGQLRAHSVVLAAASDVLREALCSNCNSQSAERRFLLPWLELDELQIAIQLIYSGTVAVPPNYASPTCLAKVFSSLKELGLKLPTSQKRLQNSFLCSFFEVCFIWLVNSRYNFFRLLYQKLCCTIVRQLRLTRLFG